MKNIRRIAEPGRRRLADLRKSTATMQTRADAARLGTRKRSIPAIGLGLAATAAMFVAVSQQAMAVNFTTSNEDFALYSNYLQGEQAAGFLGQNLQQNGDGEGVAELGIVEAKLAGLCAIASEDLPGPLGNVSLMIISGDPVNESFGGTGVPDNVQVDDRGRLTGATADRAITASNLFINTDELTGFGNKISGLNLGQSADTVANSAGLRNGTFPHAQGGSQPQAGNFGLYAENLNVAGLGGRTHGINLEGAITLPKLQLKVVRGEKKQADCATEAAR